MPDIEGVPYEATGGKLDQATAAALAARHREAATAGVSAVSAAIAPVQAQVSALSSRVDSQDAKTLTELGAVRSEAQAASSTATNAANRVTALESAADFGPSTPTDGTISNYLEQADSLTSASTSRHAQRRTRTLYPEDFGAKGDGTTDDTAALEAWLASPGLSLRMGAGRYLATRPLTSTVEGRTIWSDGGWIVSAASEKPALTITGANTRAKIGINGTGTARVGIMVQAGGCDTSGSEIVDCRSTSSTAAGIWAETALGFRCVGARIERIHSAGNTTTGDSNGAARGIYLGGSGVVATRPSLIAENEITDITGEEGDSIQVIATAGAGEVFGSMLCTVRGNIITGFSRRAIKVQASDVAVIENQCVDLSPTLTGSEHRVIYALNTDGCRVERNYVRVSRAFGGGVSVTNEGGVRDALRTVVRDNVVDLGEQAGFGLIVVGVDGAVVTGNRTAGGAVGFNVGRAVDSRIEDNSAYRSPRPVVISGTVVRSRLARNTPLGDDSGPTEIDAVDQQPSVLTWTFDATDPIPSNTVTRIHWTDVKGSAVLASEDGIITPAPGRYLVHAAVAGTPEGTTGFCYLKIINDPSGMARYERWPVLSKQLQTWSTSAVVTVPKGGRIWVEFYQTTSLNIQMNSTSRMPILSLERLD